MENVIYKPFEVKYIEPYSRYMYNGASRSGKPFNYRTDKNPFATDHWDKAAEQAGQKQKLIQAANEYLQTQS